MLRAKENSSALLLSPSPRESEKREKRETGKETETKELLFFSGDKLLQKGGKSEIKSFARVTFQQCLAAK